MHPLSSPAFQGVCQCEPSPDSVLNVVVSRCLSMGGLGSAVTVWIVLAVLVSVGQADRTLNTSECSDVAFVNEDKYLTCAAAGSHSNGSGGSGDGLVPLDTMCEGYSASNVQSREGTIRWCIFHESDTVCVTNLNYTNTHEQSSPFELNITSTGELYIQRVTTALRGEGDNSKLVSCSIFNNQEERCGDEVRLDLFVYTVEDFVTIPPAVHSIPSTPAIIGTSHDLCLEGTSGGVSKAIWTLDSTRVVAIDISDLTNPGNSNIMNPTSPLCDVCSCYQRYLSVGDIGERVEAELDRAGIAAFVVAMYQLDGVAMVNEKSRLCYGLRNRYLSVLLVRSVVRSEGGQTGFSFTVTSAENSFNTTKSFNITTGYFQPSFDVFIQPVSPEELELEPGESRVFPCNGIAAGNSSVRLQWRSLTSSTLPELEVPSDGVEIRNLTQLTGPNIQDLCRGRSGAYSLPLQSFLAPSSSNISIGPIGPSGAVFLHIKAALLICGASASLSDSYSCFATNSTERVSLTLTIRSPVVPYVIGVGVGMAVLTLLVVLAIILVCWCRYRSKKADPTRMDPEPRLPLRGGSLRGSSRHGIVNPTFPAYDASPLEFPRENLTFLSILGEGQFGVVWKASAEGICPQDSNRHIVAVKTLKDNATLSDKNDLETELMTMKQMKSHPNITNFLGMCTEIEPLLILMEFAVYGSLKNYLKSLNTGRLAPLHPRRAVGRTGQGVIPYPTGGPCSCPCHTLHSDSDPALRGRAVHASSMSPARADTSSAAYTGYHDPAVVAHAARLLRLLDSNYYHQSGSNANRRNGTGPSGGSESDWPGGGEPYAGDEGMCAYHSDVEETPYYWVQRSISQYYNSYYNHQPSVVSPPGEPAQPVGPAGEADNVFAETPGTNAPLIPLLESPSAPLSPDAADTPVSPGTNAPLLAGPPSSNNIPSGDECCSDHCCPYHSDSVSSHSDSNHSHCCSGHSHSSEASCNDTGSVGSYRNVASGCIYCSTGQEGGVAGGADICLCPDVAVMEQGRLSYFEVLDYSGQVARGMEHLEKMKCVHRDLAARNVLIAEGFLLKICDFGLSRHLTSWKDYYRKITPGKIPARWMALESLQERTNTSKSDVWSYGVVLWELLTYGDLPYGNTPTARHIDGLADYLSKGQRLPQPTACSDPMYELLKMCWDEEPDRRPSFTQLAQIFSTLLERSPPARLNMSMEAASTYPETAALESQVFSSIYPWFRASATPLLHNGVSEDDSYLAIVGTDAEEGVMNGHGVAGVAESTYPGRAGVADGDGHDGERGNHVGARVGGYDGRVGVADGDGHDGADATERGGHDGATERGSHDGAGATERGSHDGAGVADKGGAAWLGPVSGHYEFSVAESGGYGAVELTGGALQSHMEPRVVNGTVGMDEGTPVAYVGEMVTARGVAMNNTGIGAGHPHAGSGAGRTEPRETQEVTWESSPRVRTLWRNARSIETEV